MHILGYADEKFGYRLWDTEDKNVIGSKDVVFLEDQTLEDFKKKETTQTSTIGVVDLDPIPSPIVHGEGEAQDVEAPTQEEQGSNLSPLRRSIRKCHPPIRYSTNEYVMVTDVGEPKSYQET